MNVVVPVTASSLPLAGVNVLSGTVAHRLWSHPMFSILGKPVYFSSDILMLLLSAGLMLVIFPTMAHRLKKHPVPTGFRNFFEAVLVFLQRDTFEPMLGKWASVFTPYLWTAFFFILFADLFGMLPVDELVTLFNAAFGTHIPAFWGDATGNLTVTATLAVCTFVTVHVSGLSAFIRHARNRHQPHAQEHSHGHHVHAAAMAEGPRRMWPVAAVVGVSNYFKHLVPPRRAMGDLDADFCAGIIGYVRKAAGLVHASFCSDDVRAAGGGGAGKHHICAGRRSGPDNGGYSGDFFRDSV